MSQDDAATPVAATPIPDVIVDRARLPPGAVVQIGVPRFVAADALQHLTVRPDGVVLGFGFEYARLWDVTGDARWGVRTRKGRLHAAVASSADVVALVEGGSIDSTLTVVDLATGAPTLERPFGDVYGVAVSPDGRQVLVLSNTLALLDVASGDVVRPPRPVVARVGIVGNDRSVAVVKGDQVLRWSGGGEAPVVVATLPVRPKVATFSVRGDRLAWANGDRFGVLDVESGAAVMDAEQAGLGVVQLAISGDGERLALGLKGKLVVWDVGEVAPAWERGVKYMADPPAAFLDNGDLVAGEIDTVVHLAPDGTVRQRPAVTRFLGFATTGSLIVDVDGRQTGFDPTTLREIPVDPREQEPVPEGAPEWVDRAAVASDGGVTGWSDDEGTECGVVRIWRSGGKAWTTPKPKDCDATTVLGPWVFGPGMVVDVTTNSPMVYDSTEERLVMTIPADQRELVVLAGSPDLDLILAVFKRDPYADDDEEDEPDYGMNRIEPGYDLEVWSRVTGKQVSSADVPVDRGGAYDAIIRRDGKVAYIGWGHGVLDEVALPGGTIRTVGQHPVGIRVIDQSPTSQHISTLDDDGRAIIWE